VSSGAFKGGYTGLCEGTVSMFLRPVAELGAGFGHPAVQQP